MEMVLTARLTRKLDKNKTTSGGQFRFRVGALDATQEVMSMTEEERTKTWRTRQFCLGILLDIQNAFDSMP